MTIETTFYLRIHDGKDAQFANAAQAITDDAEANEPGTLSFRWLREDGGNRVLFRDVFRDAEAFCTHVHRMQDIGLFDRLMATCDLEHLEVIGNLDEEAVGIVDGFDGICYNNTVGFKRHEPQVVA